jgi:membrane-bound serine protease (ClpP class)
VNRLTRGDGRRRASGDTARKLGRGRLALRGLLALAVCGPWALQLTLAAQSSAGAPADKPRADKPHAPYHPDPSPHASAAKRELKLDVAPGAKVVRIPITGTIDLGLAAFVERSLEAHAQAQLIVLDINTLGGRVDAAIRIRDALLAHKTRTVAFIAPRAISAGALIALACDVIAMTRGASLGAVTPMSGEGQQSEAVEEKMTSYMRTEMRSTAEAKGRRGDIAEAMVDRDVEIEGVDAAGKLLTLDTDKALALAIADLQADSLADVLRALGFERPELLSVQENWAEKIARFLTDPTVSGLLMSLGMLGLLIELYSPGVGLPGAVGVLCLVMFFAGHTVTHLAGLEEILLLVFGLGLLALEIFIIPGFGVAGIAGIACVGVSFVLTLLALPWKVAWDLGLVSDALERVALSLLATMLLSVIAFRFLPRTRAGRGLVLASATRQVEGYVSAPIELELVGASGVAATDLRPGGKADLNGRRVDVLTEGEFIERGSAVRVVQANAGKIVVRRDA